jgi:REP element-mobilizing transposase RayT
LATAITEASDAFEKTTEISQSLSDSYDEQTKKINESISRFSDILNEYKETSKESKELLEVIYSENPYFDKNDAQHLVWSKQLPHWHQDEKYIFVTFRLADSLPQSKLNEFRAEKNKWISLHPFPWSKEDESDYHRKFSTVIDKWLDSNYGSCILRDEKCRAIVENALHFYDAKRYELIAYVVMPNHVHVCFMPLNGFRISQILHTWKSYSANSVNKVLNRTGKVWQKEYFDRYIRDESHFERVIRYIRRNNPSLAWLAASV